MAKINWPYVAGFFDGEGCVYLPCGANQRTKNGNFLRTNMSPKCQAVQAADAGRALLLELQQFLDHLSIRSRVDVSRLATADWKEIHRIVIQGRSNVIPFLRYLLPYLRIRKTIAQDLLRFLALYPSLKGGKYGGWLIREGITMGRAPR